MENSTKHVTRGVRNNNPCNLRRGSSWKGLAVKMSCSDLIMFSDGSFVPYDKEFCQFVTMGYGVRAFLVTLRTYVRKYKIYTIQKFVNCYAPASDNNNVTAYCDYLVRSINEVFNFGIKRDDDILAHVFDDSAIYRDLLFVFASAVCQIESKYRLPREVFENALDLM